MIKTFSAKPSQISRQWYLLDASEAPLGRVATKAATLLIGKGKPQFTKHIDCGDFVVITNAEKLVVTGNKMADKQYFRHSQYPGGISELRLEAKLIKDPTSVIIHAVRGMLPVNKLRPERLKRLKVFGDAVHDHEAQKPIPISVKGNSRGN